MSKERNDLTLLVVGDILINKRKDPVSIFANVRSLLQEADLLLGNQETPICDRGEPILGKIEVGSGNVRAVPETAHALREVGFKAVGLANNHMMDYGETGLLQTIELLAEAGVAYTGAGHNVDEAHQPVLLEVNGTKVALLAYTSVYPPAGYPARQDKPGVATVKVDTAYRAPENVFYEPGTPPIIITIPDRVQTEWMLQDVRRAKEVADVVVVSCHWGIAGSNRVWGYQKELGRALIDAGADLIMGHHPHLLSGMEIYKGRVIAYSLGHFVTEHMIPRPQTQNTVALKCYISDKQIVKSTFVPVWIDFETFNSEIAGQERRADIIASMREMSSQFGTILTIDGNEVLVTGPAPGTPAAQRAPEVLVNRLYTKGAHTIELAERRL